MSRQNRNVVPPRLSRYAGFVAAVWASVIFGTSCTFINRDDFIRFVQRWLPAGMSQQLWIWFWSVFGLCVVKLYHMTEFGVLCGLLFWLFAYRRRNRGQAIIAAALVSVLYAICDEWHQTFVPGRGGTWTDVLIDCVGILIALTLLVRQPKGPSGIRHVASREPDRTSGTRNHE